MCWAHDSRSAGGGSNATPCRVNSPRRGSQSTARRCPDRARSRPSATAPGHIESVVHFVERHTAARIRRLLRSNAKEQRSNGRLDDLADATVRGAVQIGHHVADVLTQAIRTFTTREPVHETAQRPIAFWLSRDSGHRADRRRCGASRRTRAALAAPRPAGQHVCSPHGRSMRPAHRIEGPRRSPQRTDKADRHVQMIGEEAPHEIVLIAYAAAATAP